MPASYNTLNYRMIGGSTWVVTGELNVSGELNLSGTMDIESGAYMTNVLVTVTSTLSALTIGAINLSAGETTGPLQYVLPTPVVGAEIWFYGTTEIGTTGRCYLSAGTQTSNIDRVFGTASELGMFDDNNNLLSATGSAIHLKAVNSSQWLVVSNEGGAHGTTVIDTTA